MLYIAVPLFASHYLVSPPKHSFYYKSEATRLFVRQIYPVNENEIQTLAGIGLIPLTLDVKMSLDASKLFFKSLCRPTPNKTSTIHITVPLFSGYFQNWFVNCDSHINNIPLGNDPHTSDYWRQGAWPLGHGRNVACFQAGSCGGTHCPNIPFVDMHGVLLTPHGCLVLILFIEWQEVAHCIPKAVPKPHPSRLASVCRETQVSEDWFDAC